MRSMEKRSANRRSIILFLTSYFARFPNIGGAMAEHYAGLYNTFSERFSLHYDCYWYDEERMEFYKFLHGRYQLTTARFLPAIVLQLFGRFIKQHKKLVVVMPYPYAVSKLPFLVFAMLLFALKLVGAVKIVLDVIDVPAYKGRETGKLLVVPFTVHEILCFKLASSFIVNSQGWRRYFLDKNVKNDVLHVISDSSFHHLIKPRPRLSSHDAFHVLYSGNLSAGRGIENLVECVGRIRKRGYNIRLLLTSGGAPKLDLLHNEWINVYLSLPYISFVSVLSKADACVIPYAPDSYWDRAFLSKLSVYMAAGKPILSTNLPEIRRILRKWNCGLVARDWTEMEKLIIRLYENPELASILGKNARTAVERVYNWAAAAVELEKLVKNVLSSEASSQ